MSELLSAIDALATVDVHDLAEPTLLSETEMLLQAQARLDGLIALRLQALEARDVTVAECGRAAKSWLIEEQHLTPADAARRMWVARQLPARPEVAAALIAGEINHDHAKVLLGCLGQLDPEWRTAAGPELLEFARDHDPRLLGQLCQQVRIRSGADEDAEAAAQCKYADRWLTLSSTFDGMTSLSGMLDPESAATLGAALAPLITSTGPEDDRTARQRYADAVVELARLALAGGSLPDHGGDRPQLLVSIDWAELRDGLPERQVSTATLNGLPISPSIARRLACDAGWIPAVLGGPSEILDLGRSQRSFSRAQRRAAALRDRGCVFPHCQAGLDRCQLHHLDYWEHLGCTDLHNSAYLCTFHHWLVHHTNWTIIRNAQGRIEVRRT